MPELTADRLRELLHYDHDSGLFKWRVMNSRRAPAGKRAGSVDKITGYVRIRIDKRIYQAHRLAFLYMTDDWPWFDTDHINGVRDDNRWANLRDVPHSINSQNQRRAHKSNLSCGLQGASWDSSTGRWLSHITVNYKLMFLGYFSSAEAAHQRHVEAKRRLHPGCTI